MISLMSLLVKIDKSNFKNNFLLLICIGILFLFIIINFVIIESIIVFKIN